MDPNTAKKIIEKARSLLGTPYKYGVKEEEIPAFIDCSSFTRSSCKDSVKEDIGRSTIIQATHGETVLEKDLQPGDLIFFRGSKGHFNDELFPPEKYGHDICIGHVTIYTGNGMIIHARGGKIARVIEEPLEEVKKAMVRIVIIKRL